MQKDQYQLIDSGNGRKLERFGPYLLDRPALSAIWRPQLGQDEWKKAQAIFTREGQNNWQGLNHLAENWVIEVAGIRFKIEPTDFGHLGIFPEQRPFWRWIQEFLKAHKRKEPVQVLNLFAYSGGSTLAAALAGASVCHLDASKSTVAWARENAELNGLKEAPVRWIIDDVTKFLKRELKRGKKYDAIILDPPSFGRGSQGEVFKIEDDLPFILEACKELLSEHPLFVLLSGHTPGLTPISMHHLLSQTLQRFKGHVDSGEMLLEGDKKAWPLPSGTYARWQHAG